MSFKKSWLLLIHDRCTREGENLEKLIAKKDLVAIGYSEHSAGKIIRESKNLLVKQGFSYYDNRRIGKVPAAAIEKIIGLSLDEQK